MALLEIEDLHATVDGHEILKGVNLTVNAGEVHSIMGPNGSGKSTLAQVLARRETYEVTRGRVLFDGKDLLEMKPEDAACEGVFLAFQYPVEIPGIGNAYFLRSAMNAIRKYHGEEELDAMDFLPLYKERLKLLEMDEKLMNRSVNEGFSGGEKKRNEILQLAMLEPKLAILDETDSGLDIDAHAHCGAGRECDAQPGPGIPGDHALSAAAGLHRSGFRARAGGWKDRALGRAGAGAGAGREGIRLGGDGCAAGYARMRSARPRKQEESGSEKSMATATGRLEKYLEAYGEVIALRREREPVWLRQLREDAWARFLRKGIPDHARRRLAVYQSCGAGADCRSSRAAKGDLRLRRRKSRVSRCGRGLPAGFCERAICAANFRRSENLAEGAGGLLAGAGARLRDGWQRAGRLRSRGDRAASGPLRRCSPGCICGIEYGAVGGWRVSAHPSRGGDRAAGAFAVCVGGRRAPRS